MQQTDKYKLNKPGVDDPITPVPLNENMDKIEAAITAEAAALERRIVTLEAHHIYMGSYTGTGSFANPTQTIHLGFTPIAVLVHFREKITGGETSRMHLLTEENVPMGGMLSNLPLLQIVDGGFAAATEGGSAWNDIDKTYYFLALC